MEAKRGVRVAPVPNSSVGESKHKRSESRASARSRASSLKETEQKERLINTTSNIMRAKAHMLWSTLGIFGLLFGRALTLLNVNQMSTFLYAATIICMTVSTMFASMFQVLAAGLQPNQNKPLKIGTRQSRQLRMINSPDDRLPAIDEWPDGKQALRTAAGRRGSSGKRFVGGRKVGSIPGSLSIESATSRVETRGFRQLERPMRTATGKTGSSGKRFVGGREVGSISGSLPIESATSSVETKRFHQLGHQMPGVVDTSIPDTSPLQPIPRRFEKMSMVSSCSPTARRRRSRTVSKEEYKAVNSEIESVSPGSPKSPTRRPLSRRLEEMKLSLSPSRRRRTRTISKERYEVFED